MTKIWLREAEDGKWDRLCRSDNVDQIERRYLRNCMEVKLKSFTEAGNQGSGLIFFFLKNFFETG